MKTEQSESPIIVRLPIIDISKLTPVQSRVIDRINVDMARSLGETANENETLLSLLKRPTQSTLYYLYLVDHDVLPGGANFYDQVPFSEIIDETQEQLKIDRRFRIARILTRLGQYTSQEKFDNAVRHPRTINPKGVAKVLFAPKNTYNNHHSNYMKRNIYIEGRWDEIVASLAEGLASFPLIISYLKEQGIRDSRKLSDSLYDVEGTWIGLDSHYQSTPYSYSEFLAQKCHYQNTLRFTVPEEDLPTGKVDQMRYPLTHHVRRHKLQLWHAIREDINSRNR